MSKKLILEAEVKSNIGDVSKDASGLASEFKVMGVSLNDVKKGFVTMGTTAKASFATIKAGIASTGIGALVLAVGSLVTFFTNTIISTIFFSFLTLFCVNKIKKYYYKIDNDKITI